MKQRNFHIRHLQGALFAASLILFGAGCGKREVGQTGRTVRVGTAKLTEMLFQYRIPIKGTVLPVQYASISAKIEGTLDDIYVDEGDHAAKGDKLFSIDRIKLENAMIVKKEEVAVAKTELDTAEIDLKLAQAHEEKAQFDLSRASKLIQNKAVSTSDYEAAVVAEKTTAAQVEKARVAVRYRQAKLVQAKTDLEIAEKDLRDSTVTAPFDCVVTEKLQEQGEYVKTGANILKLENVKKLEIVAYLGAGYHPLINVGNTRAVVRFDEHDCGDFKVTYRAETIDPVTRTFKIKVELPSDTILKSGMLCDLDIVIAESKGWGIPESAVLQNGDRFFLFTSTPDRKAKSVTIEKGISDRGFCEIVDPGELVEADVIVSGQRFVNDDDNLSLAE
ncbi:MAG: efflux RND transporter periplasmic adaptor subunit [Victivallaceae bacterium]|nr:efflux RND transporter periplasmic adaptor subunit [Victivallaceae bacterium]